MGIKNSLDWQLESAKILALIHSVPSPSNAFDCRLIISNIGKMVSHLSKLELQMRRSSSHSPRLVNEQLEKINTTIDDLEHWITMLMMMGPK
jgi:hypothetical protein